MLAFILLLVVFRRRAIERANIAGQRAGKANKVATKRLKQANRLMQAGKSGEFYDEVLRALWGYVGDKLNMPVEQLSRENISQQLLSHSVEQSVIDQFLGALDECEYARYAPGDPDATMEKIYTSASDVINELDSAIKKNK